MGLLHYESFISPYKLFITPVIGEADSDLLAGRKKSDDFTERYLPRQPEKSPSPEHRSSDRWRTGLRGEGNSDPCRSLGILGKKIGPHGCTCVGAGIHTHPNVFESTEDLSLMNSAGRCLSRKRGSDRQPAPPRHEHSWVLWSIHTNFTDQPHTHTHTHTHTSLHNPRRFQQIFWKWGSRGRSAVE